MTSDKKQLISVEGDDFVYIFQIIYLILCKTKKA